MKNNASYRVMKKNRKTWAISPVERVVPNKKKYKRDKSEVRKLVNGYIEYDNIDGVDGYTDCQLFSDGDDD